MPEILTFDIETYRPDWKIWRTRREDLDPAINAIITTGMFDGKETSISPIIEDMKAERNSIQFFQSKLEEFEGSTLVGYNILHFDVPYLVYKSKSMEKGVDIASFKLLDLYWILPYWLHNIPAGQAFFNRFSHLGNLWKFSNVVKHILKEEPNPFSNTDVFQLWEMGHFDDIKKHLELDLVHTLSLSSSLAIQETLNNLQKQDFNKSHCENRCPYQQLLQQTPDTASCYCTLLQEPTSDKRTLSAIDVIDHPLPERDVSWIPHCLE